MSWRKKRRESMKGVLSCSGTMTRWNFLGSLRRAHLPPGSFNHHNLTIQERAHVLGCSNRLWPRRSFLISPLKNHVVIGLSCRRTVSRTSTFQLLHRPDRMEKGQPRTKTKLKGCSGFDSAAWFSTSACTGKASLVWDGICVPENSFLSKNHFSYDCLMLLLP